MIDTRSIRSTHLLLCLTRRVPLAAVLMFIAADDSLRVRPTGRDVSLRTEVSSQVRSARSRFALCASVLPRHEFFFVGAVTTIGFQ